MTKENFTAQHQPTQRRKFLKRIAKTRNLFFSSAIATLLLLFYAPTQAQNSVLKPEFQKTPNTHVHADGTVCNHSHDNVDSSKVSTIKVVRVNQDSDNSESVSVRRGEITNPNDPNPTGPNFATIRHIDGPGDVNVIFGAGESSAIVAGLVQWPGTNGEIYHITTPTPTDPSILLGSAWSKNAVVSFADNNGKALGELYDVKFYNHHSASINGGQGNDNDSWGGNGAKGGPVYTSYGTAYGSANIANTSGNHWDRPVRLYAQYLPYDPAKDALHPNNYPGSSYSTLHDSVWNALATLTSTTLTTLDDNTAIGSTYGITGINGNGTIFSPVRVADPANTIYDLFASFDYYVPIYYHLPPRTIPINTFNFRGSEANSLYTSTRDNIAKDDGQELIVRIPNSVSDFTNYINSKHYYRPTTLLLSSINTFDSIAISDVEWYAAILKSSTHPSQPHDNEYGNFGYNCAHFSGYFSYQRDNYVFTTSYMRSGRYVDAAVRILDNSDVYVKNSITDVSMVQYSINTNGTTGNISSPNQQGSDVLLVLPGKENSNGERSNFRLKIDGDAHILHTQDSNYYVVSNPLTDGYLYRYDQASPGPGLPFPIAQSPVLLSGGVNRYKEADVFWSYVHPRELLTLTDSVTFSDSTKWMPYGVTKSSVYGVHGEYRGGTNISTRDIAGKDTTAIIEIGCVTDSQSYFKVYSAGMLKNYRSELVNGNDSLIVGNLVDNLAPGFYLSNDTMPLYIINDGKGTKTLDVNAGIKFNAPGIDSINKAIATATGGSDLHIQANRFVRFANGSPNFTLTKDNEIKILADYGYVHATDSITFADADSAHFTIWAQGPADATRGVFNEGTTYGGAIEIGKRFTAKYNDTKKGSGLVLVRSENDDVLVKEQFEFRNIAARDSSGELMVQAAQDIRLKDSVLLTQDGRRSMLFEAGKTAYFGNGFIAKLGRTMNNGDLTIKAGYPVFFPTADVASPLAWGAGNNYTNNGYTNRQDGQVLASGGDIWFDGNAEINLNPRLSDSVDVFIRAFNSIYLSGQFITNLQSVYTPASGTVDTILKYAETGNIESQTKGTDSDSVVYNINAADSTYLLFQAGNILGNPCGATLNYASDKWHGNILFGPNKVFAISHKGVGPTLISAARDIENQIGANFHFTYENSRLSAPGDNLLITAGRHIETHANYTIDYSTAGTNVTNNITMRAGHQADGICPVNLCKALETMSNVGYNYPAGLESQDNMFADGGSGNGSILLFDTLSYIYRGHGNILVTALNGNIESDPYLHGEAPILINHNDGTGTTRFEAIDIKLHDSIAYLAETTGDKRRNGQFYLFAYDSILTRNVQYVNKYDTGSVFISADKYKQTAIDCGLDCILGINAGHIVLGYGADAPTTPQNINDSIIFNFNKDGLNSSTAGANVHILAGFRGYDVNKYLGKNGSFSSSYLTGKDKGKAFGGNITMDYSEFWMAPGNGNLGGYTEIRTPNGNIWGKDSMVYHGFNGNLLVDAGLGSVDDPHAILWGTTGANYNLPTQVCPDRLNILNTAIRVNCDNDYSWRTGNIMLKGGTIDFADINTGNPGVGTAVYRTREGYIDTYDAFTVQNMTKGVLKYAGMDNLELGRGNNFGDVSERDFKYIPVENSGSIFFGADDNIMLNYGNSNYTYLNYGGASFALGTPGNYDLAGVNKSQNPYYYTSYEGYIDGLHVATYNVNVDGYQFYKQPSYTYHNPFNFGQQPRALHKMYRGCVNGDCDYRSGICQTTSNGARDLMFNFDVVEGTTTKIKSGGLAVVASNYIDMFTKFTYYGGTDGTGIGAIPVGTPGGTLHGENPSGYGLYIKSQFNATGENLPEARRATCATCGENGKTSYPIGATKPVQGSGGLPELTYIGFHDDARFYPQKQKTLVEAPVIEFFGHTEFNTNLDPGANTMITLRGDSLVFHDSLIIDSTFIKFIPYATAAQRATDMRYGVINDLNNDFYKEVYKSNDNPTAQAIKMTDRNLPVLELGYQRCFEPGNDAVAAPNEKDEDDPMVGGDVVVTFRHGYVAPIFNTIVANHARISFVTDSFDNQYHAHTWDAYLRTDLLRIRNKVEFWTDPTQPVVRTGIFSMESDQFLNTMSKSGMFVRHLHTEPGSELSIPGEDNLVVGKGTTIGGYGIIHENVTVKVDGIIAPGFASLMEGDCQTPYERGRLRIHNLHMEKDAELRISIGRNADNTTSTDTLEVKDTVLFTDGQVPVRILQNTEVIDEGCYLFFIYNDTVGPSKEYVKNLWLEKARYGDVYLSLNYSIPGQVWLCVSTFSPPVFKYAVKIPEVAGVTTHPEATRHGEYIVSSHTNFTFKAYYDGAPRKVWAVGRDNAYARIDFTATDPSQLSPTTGLAVYLGGGVYQYTLYQINKHWNVVFGEPGTGNAPVDGQRVWTYRNTLYFNATKEEVVSIYSITGALTRKEIAKEGLNSVTLSRGLYVVTLKDGTVHKIVIK